MSSPSSILGTVDPLFGLATTGKLPDPLGLMPPKIPPLPAPPKIPTRDDESIEAAGKRQRAADLKRKGRASTIITGGAGVTSDAPLSQPQALGA